MAAGNRGVSAAALAERLDEAVLHIKAVEVALVALLEAAPVQPQRVMEIHAAMSAASPGDRALAADVLGKMLAAAGKGRGR